MKQLLVETYEIFAQYLKLIPQENILLCYSIFLCSLKGKVLFYWLETESCELERENTLLREYFVHKFVVNSLFDFVSL